MGDKKWQMSSISFNFNLSFTSFLKVDSSCTSSAIFNWRIELWKLALSSFCVVCYNRPRCTYGYFAQTHQARIGRQSFSRIRSPKNSCAIITKKQWKSSNNKVVFSLIHDWYFPFLPGGGGWVRRSRFSNIFLRTNTGCINTWKWCRSESLAISWFQEL